VGTSVVIDGSIKAELVVNTGLNLVASTTGAAFLFDTASGALTFDADGTGSAAAIPVITLSGVTSIAATDFNVLPSV
jgi:Ca2+-binding RTX toxin-like protein